MKKAIKIMAMVLFVASLATVSSCKKSNEKQIVGKWNLESVIIASGGESYEITGEELAILAEEFGGEMINVTLEFKSDGMVYAQGEATAKYSVDGDVLTLSADGESIQFKILELTSSKLSIEGSETEEGMTMTYTLNFKKA